MSSEPLQSSKGRSFKNVHPLDLKQHGQEADSVGVLKRWISEGYRLRSRFTGTAKRMSRKYVRLWESAGPLFTGTLKKQHDGLKIRIRP